MNVSNTLGSKAVVASAIAATITLLVSAVAWFSLDRVGREFTHVSTVDFPAAQALADMESGALNAGRGANGLVSAHLMADADVRAALFKRVDEGLAKMEKGAAAYEA